MLQSAMRLVLCVAAFGSMASCGFTPMPVPDNSDMKPGPGLLTGKNGAFVIVGPR